MFLGHVLVFLVWLHLNCGVSQDNCRIARDFLVQILEAARRVPSTTSVSKVIPKDIRTSFKRLDIQPQLSKRICFNTCYLIYSPEIVLTKRDARDLHAMNVYSKKPSTFAQSVTKVYLKRSPIESTLRLWSIRMYRSVFTQHNLWCRGSSGSSAIVKQKLVLNNGRKSSQLPHTKTLCTIFNSHRLGRHYHLFQMQSPPHSTWCSISMLTGSTQGVIRLRVRSNP